MTRRAVAVLCGALVLAAGCGSTEGTPAAEPANAPKVAGRQLRDPAVPPYGQRRGPDCVDVADVTAALPIAAPGPAVRVAPNCSAIDPGPFSIPLGPPPPVNRA